MYVLRTFRRISSQSEVIDSTYLLLFVQILSTYTVSKIITSKPHGIAKGLKNVNKSVYLKPEQSTTTLGLFAACTQNSEIYRHFL